MPILKTEVLGSLIEINYQEGEKEKLQRIIAQFNNRISEFNKFKGKISDSKILFLASLKAEDKIFDLLKEISNKKNNLVI